MRVLPRFRNWICLGASVLVLMSRCMVRAEPSLLSLDDYLTTNGNHTSPPLNSGDQYTAAWWQPLSRFLQFEADGIRNLEAATYDSISGPRNGHDGVLQTKDWLLFCTEHLSKYYKYISSAGREALVERLTNYTLQVTSTPPTSDLLNTTLSIIPFCNGPGHQVASPRTQANTVALTSTMASLIRHGVRRIVVTGISDKDCIMYEACLQLLLRDESIQLNMGQVHTVQQTQLAFVRLTEEDAITIKKVNQGPKAALSKLQDVLWSAPTSPERNAWLGDAATQQALEYLYFTEPDQVLTARLDRSETLRVLSMSRILLPHRLAPYPHAADFTANASVSFRGHEYAGPVSRHGPILEECQHCMDAGHGLSEADECHGGLWWMCTLGHEADVLQPEKKDGFALFRIASGTNMVLAVGNNHARRCVPTDCHGKTWEDVSPAILSSARTD